MSETSSYLRPNRIFRIWSFTANHNQLIVRSEPADTEDEQFRAEVYFGNVQFMSIKPVHRGLFLRRPELLQRKQLAERFQLPDEILDQAFLVDEIGSEFVVSSNPAWREAPRDFDAPSLFAFDQPWPPAEDVRWGVI
ncbi:hypothetical protein GCM10010172_60200 [Paractinoplanes ferrugineus]|uniref:Uncharacterized protein n=1 Tax=Paractinoplanes ferrugineus TaxID=113564 RepID=A0A919MJ43_9ACTN|nr:hypothetical protein [Actinoplanes ferrugineus]GIE16699.1 hypothetical protein Afe05nite_85390 [Actinoplanes ferrugineus]